ncbi:hypothetical protein ACJZ2D_015657 [Fusarium nematophilum]
MIIIRLNHHLNPSTRISYYRLRSDFIRCSGFFAGDYENNSETSRIILSVRSPHRSLHAGNAQQPGFVVLPLLLVTIWGMDVTTTTPRNTTNDVHAARKRDMRTPKSRSHFIGNDQIQLATGQLRPCSVPFDDASTLHLNIGASKSRDILIFMDPSNAKGAGVKELILPNGELLLFTVDRAGRAIILGPAILYAAPPTSIGESKITRRTSRDSPTHIARPSTHSRGEVPRRWHPSRLARGPCSILWILVSPRRAGFLPGLRMALAPPHLDSTNGSPPARS